MHSQKLLVSVACLFSLLCNIPLYALYHNHLIHFLVDKHISCFQSESSMNIVIHVYTHVSLGFLGMKLLGQRIRLFISKYLY